MTRKEYRKQTRRYEPAQTKLEAESIEEKTTTRHNSEMYSTLDSLNYVQENLDKNFKLAKAMYKLMKEENRPDDIETIHARKILFKCCVERLKQQKQLEREKEFIKQKQKHDEIKNKTECKKEEVKPEKIDSIEEVREILNETLKLVLEMQEN